MRGVIVALVATGCGFSVAATGDAGAITDADTDAIVDTAHADWWDASWGHRRKITIDTAQLGGDLASFPVLVRLPVGTAGADLRFVALDQTTSYPFELDSPSSAWVEVSLSRAAPLALWLYYGNPTAAGAADGARVFGDYASVHHLGADPLDSAGHQHSIVAPEDAARVPGVAPGIVGDARNFDGTDYLVVANSEAMNFSPRLAVTAWAKVTSYTEGYQCVVCKGDKSWRMHRGGGGNGIGFGTTSGNTSQDMNGDITVNDQAWHHLAIVMDGAKKRLYIDGVQDVEVDYTQNLDTLTTLVRIGMNQDFNGRYWRGLVDELRIYGESRTPAWIAAEHLTVTSPSFVTVGADEPY